SVISTPLQKRSNIDWEPQQFKCDVTSDDLNSIVKWTVTDKLNCNLDDPSCDNFPAPTICAKPRQHIQILVTNNLSEPTTIHWHGLLMRIVENTPFSDGVPAITQCPIQPGESFLYDFWANNDPAEELLEDYINLPNTTGYQYQSALYEVEGHYVEHNQSQWVQRVPIHVGQRYSVIAHKTPEALEQNITNFWLRVEANPECIRYNTPCGEKIQLVKTIRSIVSYDSSVEEPSTEPWSELLTNCVDLDLNLLSPLPSKDSPNTIPDKIFNISLKVTMFTDIVSQTTVGEVYAGSD
ncbi:11559_t:CDS:2, partial [Racocetra fulgida]